MNNKIQILSELFFLFVNKIAFLIGAETNDGILFIGLVTLGSIISFKLFNDSLLLRIFFFISTSGSPKEL